MKFIDDIKASYKAIEESSHDASEKENDYRYQKSHKFFIAFVIFMILLGLAQVFLSYSDAVYANATLPIFVVHDINTFYLSGLNIFPYYAGIVLTFALIGVIAVKVRKNNMENLAIGLCFLLLFSGFFIGKLSDHVAATIYHRTHTVVCLIDNGQVDKARSIAASPNLMDNVECISKKGMHHDH